MKILVVDDEQSFGSLVCRTLRRLGHQPVLALHPNDALDRIGGDIDAVISDIDMPVMNGPALAAALRDRRADLPIAFCTGSTPEQDIVHEAESFGFVLSAPWTMEQMQALLDNLHHPPTPPLPFSDEITIAEVAPAPNLVVELTVSAWEEVEQLCRRREHGPVHVTVTVNDLDTCCPVDLTLLLPDGFTLTLTGEVVAVHRGLTGSSQTISLVGLDQRLTSRLRALAAATPRRRIDDQSESHPPNRGVKHELARGTADMKVSELILSNQRLKAQIETLASKMRPR